MTTIKHSPSLPLSTLIPLVQAWGKERGLHESTDLTPQLVKLMEELGEVAAGVARDDEGLILDSVGDMLVVLVQFGAVYDKHFPESNLDPRIDFLTHCFNLAWGEIKDRKGKTENGMFIKEESALPPAWAIRKILAQPALFPLCGSGHAYLHGPYRSLPLALAQDGEPGWGIYKLTNQAETLVATWQGQGDVRWVSQETRIKEEQEEEEENSDSPVLLSIYKGWRLSSNPKLISDYEAEPLTDINTRDIGVLYANSIDKLKQLIDRAISQETRPDHTEQ